jgi:hypothetical protein
MGNTSNRIENMQIINLTQFYESQGAIFIDTASGIVL